MSVDDQALPPHLTEAVLRRLGLTGWPSPDLEGLSAVYRSWCARVPFENTRKMHALRTGAAGPLPGIRADDFLEHWLAHGTGGTCWPSSHALFAVLRACGFDARLVIASMRDLGVLSHASIKVRLDGRDWLVDSSMLLNTPLPLCDEVFIGDDPVWPVEVEPVDGTHLVWWHAPPGSAYLPCRVLMDPAPYHEYLAGYERSRARSPFNDRLYARINNPGELVILLGRTRILRTRAGVTAVDLDSDGLRRAMQDDMGLSAAWVDAWAASGALEASQQPPPGPPPPPDPRVPPSQR